MRSRIIAVFIAFLAVFASVQAAEAAVLLGGYQGSKYVVHQNGDFWDFTEDLAVTYSKPITYNSLTISFSPTTTFDYINPSYDANTVHIRFYKVPGTTYTINLSNVQAADSSGNVGGQTFTVRVPLAPTPQPPIRSVKGDPYRYGVLAHTGVQPYGLSTTSTGAAVPDWQQINAAAAMGVRFMRIGIAPQTISTGVSTYDWTKVDPLLNALVARNMTALFIIDQQGAPAWGNGGGALTAQGFITPALYASYCTAVTQHLVSNYPSITSVAIGTNEPQTGADWVMAAAASQYQPSNGLGLAPFLKSCYAAVKSVAPSMIVTAPDLAFGGAGGQTDWRVFFQNLYNGGCKTGSCWDLVTVHNYTFRDPRYTIGIGAPGALPTPIASSEYGVWDMGHALQAISAANGDTVPPWGITEFGYNTATTKSTGVDPSVQAYYLSVSANLCLADLTCKMFFWTSAQNVGNANSGGDLTFDAIRLINDDYTVKPGFATFKTFSEW